MAFRDHLKARARDLLDARLHDILLSSWVSTGLINAVPHSNVMAHPESHPVRLVRSLFSADTLQLPDGSGSMNARPALLAASFVPKARLFALGEGQLVQLLQAVQKRTPQAYSLSKSQMEWINTEFGVLLSIVYATIAHIAYTIYKSTSNSVLIHFFWLSESEYSCGVLFCTAWSKGRPGRPVYHAQLAHVRQRFSSTGHEDIASTGNRNSRKRVQCTVDGCHTALWKIPHLS